MLITGKWVTGRGMLIDLGVSRLTVGSLPLRFIESKMVEKAPQHLIDSVFAYAEGSLDFS